MASRFARNKSAALSRGAVPWRLIFRHFFPLPPRELGKSPPSAKPVICFGSFIGRYYSWREGSTRASATNRTCVAIMSTPETRPRLALIGISGYGRIHLQLARECRERGEVNLVAATVINPADEVDSIADLTAHGCAIYSEYEKMLAEHSGRIDLCLIPTGIPWHARMTIAALLAGANVLVEKPLAGSVAEVEAVYAAEQKSGRFVAVGFQDLYEPGTEWLKDELLKGTIGEIQSVRFLGLWPRRRSYFTRNEWAGRLQADGVPVLDSPLNNAFGHFVMLSLYFACSESQGATRAIPDRVELFRAHEIESFDTAVVKLHTPTGAKLWFGVSHVGHETIEPEIFIHGSAGAACWRYENETWLIDAQGRRQHRAMPDITGTRRVMMAAVLRRLMEPGAPICGVKMARHHTEVIEAIHRAAPIHPFPADLVRWRGDDGMGSEIPDVIGLTPALRRAFSNQESLASSGFALASALQDR
jgi:predicted dehydrogenase